MPTPPAPLVVVGVDGSARAASAVDWAADEAARRGARLHVLHAFELADSWLANDLVSAVDARAAGEEICAAAVARARAAHPRLAVTSEVQLANPAAALADVSRRAAAVVVAARGRGAVRSQLLGSTSRRLAARAHGPVVVVRGDGGEGGGPVVVGVDRAATAAVVYALADAARRGVHLRAVHATPAPPDGPRAWPRAGLAQHAGRVAERAARAVEHDVAQLARAVTALAARFPTVEVDFRAVPEHPVEALLRHSAEAGLLVVGTRGLTPLTALVRGSVSQGLLGRARCAVAVVPHHVPP
ncbi:universal stress protein [Georgenia sp. AZ-5]|uniref:universal stress protein n=1 Tax=Georgenia sp. AZ-5 TaxID=3367526 RepID=UPI003754FA7F